MSSQVAGEKKQVEVRAGLFTSPLTPMEQVRLLGSKCAQCGEVLLGRHHQYPTRFVY